MICPNLSKLVRVSVCSLLLLLGPREVFAKDDVEAAGKAFRTAEQALKLEDYAKAASHFREAFRLAPNGGVAYNEALAWGKLDDAAREASALVRALSTGGLPARERVAAEKRLAALEKLLLRVRFDGPPTARVSIGGEEIWALPTTLLVRPGHHDVTWESGDRRVTETISGAAGEALNRTHPPIVDESQEAKSQSQPTAGAHAPSPSALPIVGWTLFGVGLGGLTAGGITGLYGYYGVEKKRTDGPGDDEAAHKSLTFSIVAGVTLGVGAAVAAAGVVTLIVHGTSAPSAEPSASVRLRFLPLGIGLSADF